MAFDYWFSWASQLQAGDQLWYQRCEGAHVEAKVVETCPGSNACWVEYYVTRPQGGRQHRRALVKLDELARIQREHGELIDSQSEEADANCGLPFDEVEPRERAFSMVIADASEDDSVDIPVRNRTLSMVFADDDPLDQRRPRAFSMLSAAPSDDESEDVPHPRAFSMIWSDELEDIDEGSEEAEEMESEVAKQWSDSEQDSATFGACESDSQKECHSSDASQRSTAWPESESPVLGAYGEDDCLWPSAQWTLPELVGLEPGQVELFCDSAPDTCTSCCKPMVGHTVHKVEAELSELCRLLQMKASFLEATEEDDFPSLENLEMKAWIYEDGESEELDPCKAFSGESEEDPEATVEALPVTTLPAVPETGSSDVVERVTTGQSSSRPKKKAGLVARALALLGCQSGAKAKAREETGPPPGDSPSLET